MQINILDYSYNSITHNPLGQEAIPDEKRDEG